MLIDKYFQINNINPVFGTLHKLHQISLLRGFGKRSNTANGTQCGSLETLASTALLLTKKAHFASSIDLN